MQSLKKVKHVNLKSEKNSKNKDDLDNNFPYPIEGSFWTDKEQFLDKLVKTEKTKL